MDAGADTYGNEPVTKTTGTAGRIVWSLIAAAVYFAVIWHAFGNPGVNPNLSREVPTDLQWIKALAMLVVVLVASVTMAAKGSFAFSTAVCILTWWIVFHHEPLRADDNGWGRYNIVGFGFLSLMFLWGAHAVKRLWRLARSEVPQPPRKADALIMFGLVLGVGLILTQSWAAGLIVGIIAAVALFWSSKRLGRFPVRLAKHSEKPSQSAADPQSQGRAP